MKRDTRKEIWLVILILAVAAFFRLYQIGSIPPGLYPDEAMNGTNALEALDTAPPAANWRSGFKLFYPENNGREGLFINIQALSIKLFGIHPWSLRIVSALLGILTVLGLYLLTREMYDRRLAAIAGFLMAITFWHVNFSRIGFRAIMVPFILVYTFYFLWRGLKFNNKRHFFIAGIFGGLGFYTYTSYRVVPFIAIILFLNYWSYLKKDFSYSQYEYSKIKLLQGFVILLFTTAIVAAPIGYYYYNHSDQFFSRAGAYLSVFHQNNPISELFNSVVRTLGMFNFSGDWNQRHNIAGAPLLSLPMSILFIIGFIHELVHWLKRKHGHWSTTHTLLFSWFFIMLLPGFLSIESPHALRTIGVIPVVIIFTAKGLWWLFDKLGGWYDVRYPYVKGSFSHSAAVSMVAIIFLISLAFLEYSRYFVTWAKDPATPGAFSARNVEVANQLNQIPVDRPKYVIINASGTLVNGLPMPAQTIMYLTDTGTSEKQKNKNYHYLLPEQIKQTRIPPNAFVISLE